MDFEELVRWVHDKAAMNQSPQTARDIIGMVLQWRKEQDPPERK